jgi:hypothetical protein
MTTISVGQGESSTMETGIFFFGRVRVRVS